MGFVLRLSVALSAWAITPDGTRYAEVARLFAGGHLFEGLSWSPSYPFLIPPVYPFLIACLSPIVPDLELAGRLVSVVMGTILILPGYVLARRLFGSTVGLLSAFFIAIHPRLLYYGGSVLSESTYMSLATAAVERGWVAIEERGRGAALATGLLVGLAYLTRPEGGGIALLIGGWLLWRVVQGPERRQLLTVLGALAVGLLPFVVPYVLLIYSTRGSLMVSGKFRVAPAEWIPLAASLLILVVIGELICRWCLKNKYVIFWLLAGLLVVFAFSFIFAPPQGVKPQLILAQEGPLAFFRALGISLFWEAKRFPEALSLAPFFLFLIGALARSAGPYQRRGEAYLRTITLFFLALVAIFLPRRRYLVPLLPFLLPWAGIGFIEVRERVRPWFEHRYGSGRGEALVRKGMAGLLVLIALTHTPLGLVPVGKLRAAYKEIGSRLHPLVGRDTLIMAETPQVSFYAGAAYYPLSSRSFATALADARVQGVEYWLIKPSKVPEWKEELEAAERRGDLVRVDSVRNAKGEQLVMYRLGEGKRKSPQAAR